MKKLNVVLTLLTSVILLSVTNSFAQKSASQLDYEDLKAIDSVKVQKDSDVKLSASYSTEHASYDINVDGEYFCSISVQTITNKKSAPSNCNNGILYVTARTCQNVVGQTKYCFEILETGKSVVLDSDDDIIWFKGNGNNSNWLTPYYNGKI